MEQKKVLNNEELEKVNGGIDIMYEKVAIHQMDPDIGRSEPTIEADSGLLPNLKTLETK